jgi:hypothetical protein
LSNFSKKKTKTEKFNPVKSAEQVERYFLEELYLMMAQP